MNMNPRTHCTESLHRLIHMNISFCGTQIHFYCFSVSHLSEGVTQTDNFLIQQLSDVTISPSVQFQASYGENIVKAILRMHGLAPSYLSDMLPVPLSCSKVDKENC